MIGNAAIPADSTCTRLVVIAAVLFGAVAFTAAAEGDAVPVTEAPAEEAPAGEVVSAVPVAARMLEITGEGANYWPRWRGPSGQGIVSDDYDYPHRWSREENILWRAEVPGLDSSSPIVWGDKVFLVTAEEEGDARTRSILGFSATDGELLWRTAAPAANRQPTRRRADRAIATPTTDGERVYAFLGDHGLMAVDFNGKQVWHRDMGQFDHATSSALLIGNYLVVVQIRNQRRGSFVKAFDKATGRQKWFSNREENFASGSPIAIQVGEQQQVVVSAQESVRALDPITGAEIWSVLGTEQNAIPTPVVGLGMVYVTSGPRGKTMALHATGSGNVTGSHIAWMAKETGPLLPSPLFYDGYLFLLNDALGSVTCFDGGTGEVLWSEKIIDSRGGGLTASPVLVDGKLFVTDGVGDTHIFAAGPEFKFLGTNRLGEEVRASPALSEGVWYFRTRRHLIAISTP